jgi:hypothetical protein
MGQGTSGTYSFNGANLLLMPTEAGWMERELVGLSGNGRPTYPALRQFQMTWELMDMASFSQIQGFYDAIQSTGSVIVDLPKYGATPYQFYSYSGCTLEEPRVGKFFEQWVQGVSLLILKIK